jgi:hypothetical protein
MDEARELQAGAIRAEIKQISNALADANDRLFALYAGPKPASQGVA